VADDRVIEALREAIAEVAEERVASLVHEARAEAEARVRARLSAAFEAAMLEEAGRLIGPDHPAPASRPPVPEPTPEPESEPQGPPPAESPAEEFGYYVYGVASAEEASVPEDLEGVDAEHPVSLIGHRDLVAFASQVPLSEFGEEPLHENLNDVEWLEAKARAHERVLDNVLARMPVVPMRLCTIYRSEGHVRELLEREHDVFADALARLEGKTEWGVKVIAEPGALESAAERESGAGGASPEELSAGAAYMREKSRAARRRDAVDRVAEAWAQDVHDRVAEHAVEALLNPLQNPEVSGHTGDMLLNGVYLVDDTSTAAFHSALDSLATEYQPHGVAVELTGPWPPYNFVKGSIEAAR
jgi:hypothetical protein